MYNLHLIIHGRVQGVFFRAETERVAHELGLTGWVRNTPDGAVEITAEGETEALKKLLEWCRVGPSGARVHKIEEDWKEIEVSAFDQFTIAFNPKNDDPYTVL